jgi:D-serine dehydratase
MLLGLLSEFGDLCCKLCVEVVNSSRLLLGLLMGLLNKLSVVDCELCVERLEGFSVVLFIVG